MTPLTPAPPSARVAVVSEHVSAGGRLLAAVAVRYPDLTDHRGEPVEAGPFQVAQPFGGGPGPQALRLPAVGDQVLVVPLPGSAEADGPTDAVVVGSIYPDASPLPADDPQPESAAFLWPDGTRVEYHPVDGLTVDSPLKVVVKSADKVYLGGEEGAEGVARWTEVAEELDALRALVRAHVLKPPAGAHPDAAAAAELAVPVPDRASGHTLTTL